MMRSIYLLKRGLLLGLLMVSSSPLFLQTVLAETIDISQTPIIVGGSNTPLVMLVLGRDHKIYYEAYNDASDLDGDGVIDTTYKPGKIDYFGLFDSFLCYQYASGKFTPVSKTVTKKCPGQWSGDFLNYLTTSRLDALRKVLYGGYRSSDTTTDTVLERAYIPQDAHSWGKEYNSLAYDGYLISDYTPLALPVANTRHLFSNVTLRGDATNTPLLQVLNDTTYRIWEWVSMESPVAGTKCVNQSTACEKAASSNAHPGHPNNEDEFRINFIEPFANQANMLGSVTPVTTINGSRSTSTTNFNNYLTVFTGTINIPSGQNGDYTFAVDGDDAVEVLIDGKVIAGAYGPRGVCNCYTYSGVVNLTSGSHTVEFHHEEAEGGDSYKLSWKKPGTASFVVVPSTAYSNLTRSYYSLSRPASTITPYTVRVDACVANLRVEGNPDASEYCAGYPVGSTTPTIYKPAGLLQQYGQYEPERMAFGLLSGSYLKNTDGGVVRKNLGPFSKTGDTAGNEIDRATGRFSAVNGIVKTLDKLSPLYEFGTNFQYNDNCGWVVNGAITAGQCKLWGNPVGEMMYETLRYFKGRPTTNTPLAPTPAFTYPDSSTTGDPKLGLPLPTWTYPFRTTAGGYNTGSKCFMLTISDINPSYDTDKVPGSAFASFTGDLSGLNVAELSQIIWTNENLSSPVFIGHSLDNNPVYDNAPTSKEATSLGRIRGLAPEEPTKQGGYYSAAVAYYGNTQGLGSASSNQRVETFSVALASPLPRLSIPVGSGTITIVPFAKSVNNYGIYPDLGRFQPTNQIVDFYIEKMANMGESDKNLQINEGRPYGVFRINYEDVEQGADHDMDAIVRYEFWVQADNTLKIKLDALYASGSITQHMGYVISGTDGQDGVYLDIRDSDTTSNMFDPARANSYYNDYSGDVDYFLDTPLARTTLTGGMTKPRSTWTSSFWKDLVALPTTATRLFKPGTSASNAGKFVEQGPLWYAAKWGGFHDQNNNKLPDAGEWDTKKPGEPDNYFLVTNAGTLKTQLSSALLSIMSVSASASMVALNSSKAYGPQNHVYQAQFNSGDWSGDVLALNPQNSATGTLKAAVAWSAGVKVNQFQPTERQILTYKPSTDSGVAFRWPSNPAVPGTSEFDTAQAQALSTPKADGTYDAAAYAIGEQRLNFLRGDNSLEGQGVGKYRKRSSDLGDFVSSNSVYVDSDIPMLYVGSNDGMMHGFSTQDGSEKIAYVPSVVFKKLPLLTDQDYNTTSGTASGPNMNTSKHRYYVDGGMEVAGKIPLSGPDSQHTVLVGRLGGGGQGVFALDITSPANFSEANAKNLVLWELTDSDDADLGYTFGQAWITQMNDGSWVALISNGYNSIEADGQQGTGRGVLFVVNLKTGAVIKKFDLGVNSSGLSAPTAYDKDTPADGKTDFIYAGDLNGNLWRFDVRDSSATNWTASVLFSAQNTSGVKQPITSAPSVKADPENNKTIVLFGTGRYFATSDMKDTVTQSYYGIFDDGSGGAITRTNLLKQQFITTVAIDGQSYRTSSNNAIQSTHKGWYIDLTDTIGIPGVNSGSERVYEDSGLYQDKIVFTSKVPASVAPDTVIEPCISFPPGGRSYINVLSIFNGGSTSVTFVKVDGEGVATDVKTSEGVAPTSQSFAGITSGISVTLDGYVLMTRPARAGETIGKAIPIEVLKIGGGDVDLSGRKTWRQIQ